ncbi:MAG: hypothetical protein HY360_25815 [Verrucomicrobia bacterium]|nr:hypothetical protein [Verrucomicrobiota bacterium]
MTETLWNLDRLRQPPSHTRADQSTELDSFFYEGEPYRGKPTRVFADQHLLGGAPLPVIQERRRTGNRVAVRFDSALPVARAELHSTTDMGPINQRNWQTIPVPLERGTAVATLPSARPLLYFVNLTDVRGAIFSSEHEEVKP